MLHRLEAARFSPHPRRHTRIRCRIDHPVDLWQQIEIACATGITMKYAYASSLERRAIMFAPRSKEIVNGGLLTVLLGIHIAGLRHKGLTTDEPVHYEYGYRVLHSTSQRTHGALDASTMPFSSVNVIASESIAAFASRTDIPIDSSPSGEPKRGRYATVAFSLLLAAYVLKWSYDLYGRNGALLSVSLYVFDPNLLAHGQLVTADFPAALMTTIALYHFWRFLKLGGNARALASATILGLSQLAKYSCAYLYPIFLVLAAIYRPSAITPKATSPSWQHRLIQASVVTAVFAAISIVIINLGFSFNRSGAPLSEYTLNDPFFKKLQVIPIIGNFPLPLPVPYVQGLDLVRFEERMGPGSSSPSGRRRSAAWPIRLARAPR